MHTDNQKTLEMLAALLSGVIARAHHAATNTKEAVHGDEAN